MRILYVHHRTELGGAPTSLSYLISQLDRDRYEPHVYCPEGPSADLFRSVGATVHTGPVASFTHIWASTYSGRRWLLLARELAQLPGHLRRFRQVLRATAYDLVHLNDSPLVPAAYVARRAGIPVVWHLRSALPETGRRRSNAVRRAIRRTGAASIAINANVAASFDVGAAVIANAVDLERFRPGGSAGAKEPLGIEPLQPVVAFFGFVYPSKGFRDFITAASLLRSQGSDAVYLIVGGDVRGEAFYRTLFGRTLTLLGLARNYEQDAKELVAELGLERAVRFVPFTRDIAALYRASDVVVAPSRGPELGRPVLEASACGRAVVASGSIDGGGIVLPGETGYLVPRRSPDVLAAALERLLGDDDLRRRLGEHARTHAEASFDPRRNAEQAMKLYERATA